MYYLPCFLGATNITRRRLTTTTTLRTPRRSPLPGRQTYNSSMNLRTIPTDRPRRQDNAYDSSFAGVNERKPQAKPSPDGATGKAASARLSCERPGRALTRTPMAAKACGGKLRPRAPCAWLPATNAAPTRSQQAQPTRGRAGRCWRWHGQLCWSVNNQKKATIAPNTRRLTQQACWNTESDARGGNACGQASRAPPGARRAQDPQPKKYTVQAPAAGPAWVAGRAATQDALRLDQRLVHPTLQEMRTSARRSRKSLGRNASSQQGDGSVGGAAQPQVEAEYSGKKSAVHAGASARKGQGRWPLARLPNPAPHGRSMASRTRWSSCPGSSRRGIPRFSGRAFSRRLCHKAALCAGRQIQFLGLDSSDSRKRTTRRCPPILDTDSQYLNRPRRNFRMSPGDSNWKCRSYRPARSPLAAGPGWHCAQI